MTLTSYLRATPKAELHLHLEGSVQPATALALAERNGATLPADTVEGLREWFRFRDFAHFIEVYGAVSRCLRTAGDYELIAYELAEALARQHCHYAEVGFSPAFHARMGVAHETYVSGLTRARKRAHDALGVELAWVFDISRAMRGGEAETMRWADYTVGAAIDSRRDGVVALGLGGPEDGHPPEPFAPYFEGGRGAGLHAAPHAGEHAGPASIRGALDALGAERIAHGVRAVEDPALVEELAARGIVLDICPTSNVRLGVYPNLAEHPLPLLHAAGVTLTINSDDPPLFGTTLTDEVLLLAVPFGIHVSTIDDILLNGVRHSFLPAPEKERLLDRYLAEQDAHRAIHLTP